MSHNRVSSLNPFSSVSEHKIPHHNPILCLSSSYPQYAEDLSGHFVAHFNHCLSQLGYHPYVVAPQSHFKPATTNTKDDVHHPDLLNASTAGWYCCVLPSAQPSPL